MNRTCALIALAVVLAILPQVAIAQGCSIALGFTALRDALGPTIVGDCLDNEFHDPNTGDAFQHTTRGLLIWHRSDNSTAFTDGTKTWVKSTFGIQEAIGAAIQDTPSPGVNPLSKVVQTGQRGSRTVSMRPLHTTIAHDGREAVADRIVVGFQAGVVPSGVHSRARSLGVASASVMRYLGSSVQLVNVLGTTLDQALTAYRSDPRVRYAEPDYLLHVDEVPNDPLFSQQWGMTQIKAPSAWNVTHGSNGVYVAVIDTGIYDELSTFPSPDGGLGHPDLRGMVAADVNFTSEADTDDNNGHGTHVAGIAAANTNNGLGVAGAGYSTRLMNVKVADSSGTATDSTLISGIRWAADHFANVANISLGATGACPSSMQDAIDYAWARNVVIVAAAGNDGTSNVGAPASCNHVLAVASVDSNDAKSGFSTFGTWVQLAAPGGSDASGNGILSTSNDGTYVRLKGTSMAAPHVSGVAALVWATSFGSSNNSVVNRLLSTADRIGGTGSFWANGRLNAFAAVSPPVCSPRPAVGVQASPNGPGRLQVTVTASGVNVSLLSIQFGNSLASPSTPSNALIDIGSQIGQTGSFTVALQPVTTQTTFSVRRQTARVATTVPMIVTDSCGSWPTLVGGGAGAF